MVTHLVDNQPKRIDVCLRSRYRLCETKLRRHQEFWGHEHRCATSGFHVGCHRLAKVEGNRHKAEVREAGTWRVVVGHEDVRLLSVKENDL